MIPETGLEETGPAAEISIERIVPNPYQPRRIFDEAKLEELSRSIALHGVLQPVLVRSRGYLYELIAGERRLQAATRAGLKSIPAIVKSLNDPEMLEVALIENIQREDINALEAALAFRRLSDEFGMTQEDISVRVGKSRTAIANTLRLLQLPTEIQDSIAQGQITEGHARALLSMADPLRQRNLWQRIIRDGLSVRDAEKAAKEQKATNVSRETLPKERPDPNIAAIEAQLRDALGTRVTIRTGKSKGMIEIEFYTDEDLERIVSSLIHF